VSSKDQFLMANAIPTIVLHASVAPRKLPRPIGFKPVSVSVASNGKVIRLLVPEKIAGSVFATVVQPGWASFPKTRTEEGYSSMVVLSDIAGSEELQLAGLTATYPMIDVLPGNQILVVAPRCQRFRDGSHELNAKI